MNIVLINHYAGSPYHGMEFRPFYMAREWVKRGHQVTIVAASFSHVRIMQPELMDVETIEDIEGIKYRWLATPPYQGNGLKRVRNMVTFVARLMRRAKTIAEECSPDAVIASSTYPLDIFPARIIAQRANARLIFEVHDLWPLTPRILGNMSKWHPFIMIMQMAENAACRWADAVVSILPATKDYLIQHGMSPEKFYYIPNGISPEEWIYNKNQFLPKEHTTVLDDLKAKGCFLVGYVGAHGLANNLDILLDVAILLPDTIHIILVGNGPEKPRLKNNAINLGLNNIHFLPPVPKALVPAVLNYFDALVLTWKRCQIYSYGISPNKLFDYMMSGKPIVHAIETTNDPVQDAECGFSVPPEDPVEIARAIQHLAELDVETRNRLGQQGRSYVLTYHSYEKLAEDFEKVLIGEQPGDASE